METAEIKWTEITPERFEASLDWGVMLVVIHYPNSKWASALYIREGVGTIEGNIGTHFFKRWMHNLYAMVDTLEQAKSIAEQLYASLEHFTNRKGEITLEGEIEIIGKNTFKGDQICTIDEVVQLAKERKTCWHTNWRMRPAGFLVNMRVSVLQKAIKNGQLFRVVKIEPPQREK